MSDPAVMLPSLASDSAAHGTAFTELLAVLRRFKLEKFGSALRTTLGVEQVSDLSYFTDEMLRSIGLRPVHVAKFHTLLQVGNSAPASSAFSVHGTNNLQNRDNTGSDGAASSPNVEDLVDSCTSGEEHDDEDSEWLLPSDAEGDRGASSSFSKKRKRKISKKDRNRSTITRAAGAAQVSPPDLRANGEKASSSASAVADGCAQVARGRVGITCECTPLVEKIISRLPEAELTTAGRRHRKGFYSYKRLGELVLECVFDAAGNWVVHRKCIAPKLPVSPAWLSAKHARAVELARVPCSAMKKSDIIWRTPVAIDRIIANIIMPAHVNISPRQYFAVQPPEYVFKVAQRDKNGHGLLCKPSNRSRIWERMMFGDFIRAERMPNGRTTATDGRSHGATFYLNSVFKSVRCASNRLEDQASSLAWTFNEGLRKVWSDNEPEKQFKALAVSTILSWMVEDFGPRKRIAGISRASEDHTTLYPHKTDACAFCESTRVAINSLQQQEKRHLQQHDQGSLTKQRSLQEVRAEIKELEESLGAHKQEASKAIKHHKACTENAHTAYTELCVEFGAVLSTLQVSADGVGSVNEAALDVFLKAARNVWFEVSSDYQQDKAVPSWNDSPQPGLT